MQFCIKSDLVRIMKEKEKKNDISVVLKINFSRLRLRL